MSNQSLYGPASPYYSTNVVENKFLDVMVARPIPQNFRIGCDEYWLYHDERYDKSNDNK
jgi:hypothetical protein